MREGTGEAALCNAKRREITAYMAAPHLMPTSAAMPIVRIGVVSGFVARTTSHEARCALPDFGRRD